MGNCGVHEFGDGIIDEQHRTFFFLDHFVSFGVFFSFVGLRAVPSEASLGLGLLLPHAHHRHVVWRAERDEERADFVRVSVARHYPTMPPPPPSLSLFVIRHFLEKPHELLIDGVNAQHGGGARAGGGQSAVEVQRHAGRAEARGEDDRVLGVAAVKAGLLPVTVDSMIASPAATTPALKSTLGEKPSVSLSVSRKPVRSTTFETQWSE